MRLPYAFGVCVVIAAVAIACSSDAPTAPSSTSIGPTGGTIAIDGASLTVPPGALDAEVTILLSAGTAPSDARSSLYTFKPSSLAFTKAATFQARYTGSYPPVMMWSGGSSGSYVALPTQTLAGGWASAEITQLGSLYVLGGSGDGGSGDASAGDGSADASDAALDGGACGNPPPALNLPAGTPSTFGSLPKGSYNCVMGNAPVAPSIYTFTLATPAQVSMAYTHSLLLQEGFMHLTNGCDETGPILTSATYCHSTSKLLAPGTYSWVQCLTGGPNLFGAAPPTSASNTVCNAAAVLPNNGTLSEPGITDGQPRIYSFTNASARPTQLSFGNATYGSVLVSVRTDCTNPSTAIVNATVDLCAAGTANPLSLGTLTGTYYVVVTTNEAGQRYSVGVTHN